ncbi:hypothetical protein [Actinomycetospora chibensis]|uniref:Uncharacterized protein n=1 Tax=Actinomycetospora chibensis TaxID=663606 RepID=A0ABV9RNZ9_9PSEU|nr:hypothetical protein [Actinomycetospora chibensis]MDD7922705.1 hypothetical protein [Actinomycetospora chibensis]
MIRPHGCSRHRSPRAVSTTLLATWSGRLALLVAALGLVLMHHVVGAHQHATGDTGAIAADHHPAAAGGTSAPSVEHGAGIHGPSPADHALRPEVATTVPAADSTSSAALLHDHSDQGGHDHSGSLLHMCLAALVGAAALLVLVLVASWCRFGSLVPVRAGVARATAPRAPPTLTRLAQLQVLRL